MKYQKEEYQRFKYLLEYFVAHLEYIACDYSSSSLGYEEYIKPLVESDSFKSSGQGYNGQAIQSQVSQWDQYQNGQICINVYGANYQSRGTYLNWQGTGNNIMADWKGNHVENLYLLYYDPDSGERLSQNVSFTIKELGLFDTQTPNDNLCSLFDEYNLMIETYRNKQHNMEVDKYIDLLKTNKNLILTGAPGTGKTFLAKEIAKAMGCNDNEIGFVQFHPSYDYTDFVEGLKPNIENGSVGFCLVKGVFKRFCENAICQAQIAEDTLEFDLSNPEDALKYFKLTCNNLTIDYYNIVVKDDTVFAKPYENEWKMPDEDILNYITTGIPPKGEYVKTYVPGIGDYIKNRIMTIKEHLSPKDALEMFKKDYAKGIRIPSKSKRTSTIFDVTIQDGKNKKTILVNGHYVSDNAILRYIQTGDYNKFSMIYEPSVGDYIKEKYCDGSSSIKRILNAKVNEDRPHVFIIDEINRGETSKIFGELFFSIDPGYRGEYDGSGNDNKVFTQYQNLVPKEGDKDFDPQNADEFRYGFYVPDNVYIIGTMNDIDRSVESMDFAMRRRFAWQEVTAEESYQNMIENDPKFAAIKDEIRQRMFSLNKAIAETEGLDEAYQIGAAYFRKYLDYQDKENPFDCLWNNHLRGLLYEYLRGNRKAKELLEKLHKAYNKTSTDE